MEAYNNMREEGRNAFKQGKKSNTNPYSSVEAEFWFDGFDEEAEAFMENWPNDSSVMVFDEHSNEIENYGPNNEYWAIVDNEPADDGYDYDRYY